MRFKPVQVTFESEPILEYPILQVHLDANVIASCEQTALALHSPLFT